MKTFTFLILLFSSFTLWGQKFELEEAVLSGCTTGNTISRYSGTGYVADLQRGGKVTLNVTLEKGGEYDLFLSYELTATEEKAIIYTINGDANSQSYSYPVSPGKFTEGDNLRVQLKSGENTIEIETGRNTIYNLDYLRVVRYERILDPDKALVNANATKETKELYNYFLSVYGKNIISGQTDVRYCEFVSGVTGRSPVICAFDFMDYTSNKNLNVDQAIDWAKNHQGIVAFQWHWRDPMTKNGNFYSYPEYENGTSFDASKIFEPESPEYKAMIEDIDHIASQLRILQDHNIPVLWRPLHEATGNQWTGWFWWSTGSNDPAAACKQLWNVIFDRMTNYHGLNNLIWTWNTDGTAREDVWYPGDDKVDLLGADVYNGIPNMSWKSRFDAINLRHQGKKMIAMTENGSVPDPKNLIDDDVPWLYFCTWSNMIMDQEQNPRHVLRQAFQNQYMITNVKLDVDTIPDPVDNPTLPGAFEAENATLKGTLGIYKVLDGYRGSGYVGGFSGESDELIFSINSDFTGECDLYIAYHIGLNWGDKYTYLSINGSDPEQVRLEELKDDKFHETPPVRIQLNKGNNEIKFTKNWGYYDIDYIRIPQTITGIDGIDQSVNQIWMDKEANLHFSLPGIKNIRNAAIYNAAGQKVMTLLPEQLVDGSVISCRSFMSGVYIVNLVTSEGIDSFKVVKH